MRHAAFCALALATVLVQVVLVDGLPLPGGAVPDIALVLVVIAGLTQGPVTGMLTGFVAGLGLDLAPPGGYLIGASALIFCLIGYGCGRLGGRLYRSAPGMLAVAVVSVGAGEAAQAAAGLIARDSGVTFAAVRTGLPAAVAYDALLCAVLLSVAALTRARPRVRLSALTGGTAPRISSARGARAYTPRAYAGHAWAAGTYTASRTERMPGVLLAARMSEREVPLRLGAKAHEDRRASSRPGTARSGSSGPRLLGPGRGRGTRRSGPRPDSGDSVLRPRQRGGLASGAVRVRFRGPWPARTPLPDALFRGARFRPPPAPARQPGAGSLGLTTFSWRPFRRRVRMCRRVPRWTGARSPRRGARYGRAGGLR
jgi:rod shape-determining protein MreD